MGLRNKSRRVLCADDGHGRDHAAEIAADLAKNPVGTWGDSALPKVRRWTDPVPKRAEERDKRSP